MGFSSSKCIFVQIRTFSYHSNVVFIQTSLTKIQLDTCWFSQLFVFIKITIRRVILDFLKYFNVGIVLFNIIISLNILSLFILFYLLWWNMGVGKNFVHILSLLNKFSNCIHILLQITLVWTAV